MKSDPEFEQLVLAAMQTPIGLLVWTNNVPRAKARFYAARRLIAGDALTLQLRTSPFPEGQLMIVRSSPGA